MADEKVVKQLVDRLSTEDLTGQELAAEQIRQACTAIRPHQLLHNIICLLVCLSCRDLVQGHEQYCAAFAQQGAIEPLVGLLDADSKDLSLTIAQSIACMVQHASACTGIR